MKLPTKFRLPGIVLLVALVLPFVVSAAGHPWLPNAGSSLHLPGRRCTGSFLRNCHHQRR